MTTLAVYAKQCVGQSHEQIASAQHWLPESRALRLTGGEPHGTRTVPSLAPNPRTCLLSSLELTVLPTTPELIQHEAHLPLT